MIAWAEKEFTVDGVLKTGFCGLFKNQETGQLARNAVRMSGRVYAEARTSAKSILKTWIEDHNRCAHVNPHSPFRLDFQQPKSVEIWGEDGEFMGWHYGEPWQPDDYEGYKMLGPWRDAPKPKEWVGVEHRAGLRIITGGEI